MIPAHRPESTPAASVLIANQPHDDCNDSLDAVTLESVHIAVNHHSLHPYYMDLFEPRMETKIKGMAERRRRGCPAGWRKTV